MCYSLVDCSMMEKPYSNPRRLRSTPTRTRPGSLLISPPQQLTTKYNYKSAGTFGILVSFNLPAFTSQFPDICPLKAPEKMILLKNKQN